MLKYTHFNICSYNTCDTSQLDISNAQQPNWTTLISGEGKHPNV